MTSGPHTHITAPALRAPPGAALRLRLKPEASATEYADGAWWPRSGDLTAELPAPPAGLAVRMGQVRRMSYNLAERMGEFRFQGAHTIDVIDADHGRVTLLVAPSANAHVVSMAADSRGNTDRVGELLACTG